MEMSTQLTNQLLCLIRVHPLRLRVSAVLFRMQTLYAPSTGIKFTGGLPLALDR